MKLINNEYASLFYYPDSKIVHHVFHQPISGESFRNVLIAGVEAFEQYGATKWLSDDRNNMALTPEDSEWATTQWSQRVLQAGWKFWALVVPDDFDARLNMKEYVERFNQMGVRIMVFVNPDDAMNWLRDA